ncbi:hypothetical protein L1276_000082 [Flavobacterium sp. HSC-32F16]|uniref:YgjV family protein n=1 Tax=Flavobacterium sp. HSC-32F16 TaxID=2910964 RepID=UPI0020A52C40|nr:YgjV family protein [Flavobacterium sp. HSC-32F16]MCP2024942.1 hypothetical protein [Flavobacterium sp. HSC-32F16]
MIHVIGYIALLLNTISITMKNVLYLRILSLIANLIYIIYGILLGIPPMIIGCAVAIMVHTYRIYKLHKEKTVIAGH